MQSNESHDGADSREHAILDVIRVRSRLAVENHAVDGFVASLPQDLARRDIAHEVIRVSGHNQIARVLLLQPQSIRYHYFTAQRQDREAGTEAQGLNRI